MIDLISKLGEMNVIEHNKGSKIYPQNQVILDCIMPSIPLMHTFSHVVVISKKTREKKSKKIFFSLLFFIWEIYHNVFQRALEGFSGLI